MRTKIFFSILFLAMLTLPLFVSAKDDSNIDTKQLEIFWFDKFLSVFGVGGYAKFKLAINNEDPSYCIDISSNHWQVDCLNETIQFNKDPQLCDKIDENNIEAKRAKDECYTNLAIIEDDVSYCNFIGFKEEQCNSVADYYYSEQGINREKELKECLSHINSSKNRCKIMFASKKNDILICENLLNLPQSVYNANNGVIYDQEYCEDSVAMETKNISLCKTSGCIIAILKGSKSYNDCSKILSSEIPISRWAWGDLNKEAQYDICLSESENPSACFEQLNKEDTSCFFNAAKQTNDASWCQFIEPYDPKDFGNKICKGAPDDPSRTCEYTEGYLNRNDLLRAQCYASINQCIKASDISIRLRNHCYYILDSYGHYTNKEREQFCSNIIFEGNLSPSCEDYETYMQQFGSDIKTLTN